MTNQTLKKLSTRGIKLFQALFALIFLFSLLGVQPAQEVIAQDETVFAVISDYGYANNTTVANIANMVNSWNPQFIVTGGDNYQETSTCNLECYSGVVGAYYGPQAVSNGRADFMTPGNFYPVPGNHDYYADGGFGGTTLNNYLAYFTSILTLPPAGSYPGATNRYYDFRRGPVHFFMMDSGSALTGSPPNKQDQQNWLEAALGASDAPWKIVMFHIPAASAGTHGSSTEMQWDFAGWGADFVIQAHNHIYERIEWNDIVYFTAGTAGYDARAQYDTGKLPSNAETKAYQISSNAAGATKVTASNTEITFEFFSNNDTDNPKDTYFQSRQAQTDPSISISPSALSFTGEPGVPSAEKSYTVSGVRLLGDVTITPPVGFEISTSGSDFSPSAINLTPSGGTLAATTIFVRMAAGEAGNYDGNILHASQDAASKEVGLSGTITESLATSWVAYNDVVHRSGQISDRITTYTISSEGTSSGELVDYNTGTTITGVQVAITTSGTVQYTSSSSEYDGAVPNSGTDAHSTFDGIVNMVGLTFWESNTPYIDMTFSGLDPNETYTFATSANRNNTEYTSRESVFTISGAAAATNASTAGVGALSNESVYFSTGYNTANGYVARWTGIKPSSQGGFAVRVQGRSSGTSYGPSVFMLAQEGASSTEPTITLSGTLTPFSTTPGEASAYQSYTVTGVNLTEGITVTPPTGFEVAAVAGGPYSGAITLPSIGGTVYIRLTGAVGNFNGEITHTSDGAITRRLAVSGTVSESSSVSYELATTIEKNETYLVVARLATGDFAMNSTVYSGGEDLRSTPVTVEGDFVISAVDSTMLWDFLQGSTASTFGVYNDPAGYIRRGSGGDGLILKTALEGTYTDWNPDTISHNLYNISVSSPNPNWYLTTATSGGTTYFTHEYDEAANNIYFYKQKVVEAETYTLSVAVSSVNGGTVTLNPAGGTYLAGTTVTLTPNPAEGYQFDKWSGVNAGDIIDTSGVFTILMDGNKSVTAEFKLIPNNPPTDILLSNSLVFEDVSIDTQVGELTTVDPDSGDTHTYTLVDSSAYPDNAAFKISGDKLLTNQIFDYATKDQYTIKIRSTDGGGLFTEVVFDIYIVESGTAPVFPSSFYGGIYFMDEDDGPIAGDLISAYLDNQSTPVRSVEIKEVGDDLTYAINVPTYPGNTHPDTVTFKIGDRVLAVADWASGTNVRLDLHPPKANAGGAYVALLADGSLTLNGSYTDWKTPDSFTYAWDLDADGEYDDATVASPSFSFTETGTTIVGLKVTDGQGGEGTDTAPVFVVTLSGLEDQVYNGNPHPVAVVGVESPYTTTVLYGPMPGSTTPPTNAGTYDVLVQIKDSEGNVIATLEAELMIAKATATVTLDPESLDQIYDGDPKEATATTEPEGLTVTITYDGSETPPSAAGSYYVVATVVDDNYEGSTEGTMTIGIIHVIDLVPGWNLISFMLEPISKDVADVLEPIDGKYSLVYAWDATGGHTSAGNWVRYDPIMPYGNTLAELDHTMGFWIFMEEAAQLSLIGNDPGESSIPLVTTVGGWNLVGYPSMVDRDLPGALEDFGVEDFTLVYAFHAADTVDQWKIFDPDLDEVYNDLKALSPGWGYWINMTAENDWTVDFK